MGPWRHSDPGNRLVSSRQTTGRCRAPEAHHRAKARTSSAISFNSSGPAEGIKGAVEDVEGKAKEAVGSLAGQDSLQREGKA